MTKYEKALKNYVHTDKSYMGIAHDSIVTTEDYQNLLELVNKETPKRPIKNDKYGFRCSVCNITIVDDEIYCSHCGQKIKRCDNNG